jgi:GNAT superfamily N-acetyltransferase
MSAYLTKIPKSIDEINSCHQIREYVLRESFSDDGLSFNHYDVNHAVHQEPNLSLIFVVNDKIVGSVRMDKEFEHLKFLESEIRLALFGISATEQGKGYGKIFFEDVIKWCQNNAINMIYTNSRLSSHPFWRKMGFKNEVWDSKLDCDTEIQMVLNMADSKS